MLRREHREEEKKEQREESLDVVKGEGGIWKAMKKKAKSQEEEKGRDDRKGKFNVDKGRISERKQGDGEEG